MYTGCSNSVTYCNTTQKCESGTRSFYSAPAMISLYLVSDGKQIPLFPRTETEPPLNLTMFM